MYHRNFEEQNKISKLLLITALLFMHIIIILYNERISIIIIRGAANMNYNLFIVQKCNAFVESSMWKVEALFQGHSPTECLLLRSFVSCEEDERSESTH